MYCHLLTILRTTKITVLEIKDQRTYHVFLNTNTYKLINLQLFYMALEPKRCLVK